MNLLNSSKLSKSTVLGAIGVIVSLLAIFAAYDIHNRSKTIPQRLEITELARVPIASSIKSPGVQLDMYLNGIHVDRAIFSTMIITNSGEKAIVPADFFTDLVLKTEDGVKLLDVSILGTAPNNLEVTVLEYSDGQFALTPMLLNPGDTISISVLVDSKNHDSYELLESRLFEWSARIRNIPSIDFKSNPDLAVVHTVRFSPVDPVGKTLIDTGWLIILNVYSLPVFLFLVMMFSAISFLIFKRAGYLHDLQVRSMLLLIISFIFGMASSEIIIFYAFGTIFMGDVPHTLNISLLVVHTAFLLGLVYFHPKRPRKLT